MSTIIYYHLHPIIIIIIIIASSTLNTIIIIIILLLLLLIIIWMIIGQGEGASVEESNQHADLQLEKADFSDLTSHAMESDIVLRPEVTLLGCMHAKMFVSDVDV